jgi:hypothetical protein
VVITIDLVGAGYSGIFDGGYELRHPELDPIFLLITAEFRHTDIDHTPG